MQQHTQNEFQKVDSLGQMVTGGIDVYGPIKTIYTLFMIFLGWNTLTLEVFSRRNFGERYITLLRLVLAWITLSTYRFFFVLFFTLSNFSISGSMFGGGPSLNLSATTPLFTMFTYGMAACTLFHLGHIFWRNRQGIAWHSQSFGVSWLSFLPIDDWKLYRFVEPALFILIGYFLSSGIDRLTGVWLMFAGACLFLKNQMAYAEERGRFLNMIDARIESTHLQEAQQGKPKQETAGFTVMPVPTVAMHVDYEPAIAQTVQGIMGEDE